MSFQQSGRMFWVNLRYLWIGAVLEHERSALLSCYRQVCSVTA